MPWNGSGGFAYSSVSANQNAPSRSGVYAIFLPNKWVYIGESADIRTRLIQHLGGDNPCITRSGATLFAYELVDAQSRVARQNALIQEIQPACNQKLG